MKMTLPRAIAAIACTVVPLTIASCGTIDQVTQNLDIGELTEDAREVADLAASRTPEGVDGSRTTHYSDLNVGDCVYGAAGMVVKDVEVIDCAEPHHSELYHAFDVDFPEYDEEEVEAEALRVCSEEFQSFVGIPTAFSTLNVSWFSPSRFTWPDGDREVMCFVEDPDGGLTGSMRGSNR